MAGPVEFREDEVFLADDPEGLAENFDSLAAFELSQAVFLAFADHEIDFDQAVVVNASLLHFRRRATSRRRLSSESIFGESRVSEPFFLPK